MKNPIPYPLRATKIDISINPFGFWIKPEWFYRERMTDAHWHNGDAKWWVRWLWFQISYSRWL